MDDISISAGFVTIEPSDQQLVFTQEEHPTPGTTGLAATIAINNKHNDKSLLFRVQTTSPLSYRVRPSHGRLEPNTSAIVNIALAVDSKKVDKFLVKWVVVDANLEGDFNNIFQFSGKAEEYRLRCVLPDTIPPPTNSAPTSALSSTGNLPAGKELVSPSSSPQPPPYEPSPLQSAESAESVVVPVAIPVPKPQVASIDKSSEVEELKVKLRESVAKNEAPQKKIDTLMRGSTNNAAVLDGDDDALLNRALVHANQHNVPPVLVALIALFAFLLGLLF